MLVRNQSAFLDEKIKCAKNVEMKTTPLIYTPHLTPNSRRKTRLFQLVDQKNNIIIQDKNGKIVRRKPETQMPFPVHVCDLVIIIIYTLIIEKILFLVLMMVKIFLCTNDHGHCYEYIIDSNIDPLSHI